MNWQDAVERTVTGLGYDLVDTERTPGGLLRVYIDVQLPGGFVTVDDCEKVTRQLQHLLEVEGCAYERLEVSSPGLDRPLKKAADFARFVGEQVEVTLKVAFQGRKKYRGELVAQGEGWRVLLADEVAAKPGKAAKPAKPAPVVKAGKAAKAADGTAQQALDFMLEEVREARLVPVVDFKGRRFAAPADDGVAAQPSLGDEVDGGRIQ